MSAPSKAFDAELGVFDPTFPGITLHYPNEDVWQHLRSATLLHVAADLRDLLQKHPELSATEVTIERIRAHTRDELNYVSPLPPEEKEQLGRTLITRDPERAVAYLAVATAFEHERRHFHDWLLSPYTAALNAMRTEIAFNFSDVYDFLRSGGTTVIPVPVTRWLRKSAKERDELLLQWSSLLGESFQLRVPELVRPDVLGAIGTIERRYRSIQVLFDSVAAAGLNAATVFEATALLIQTQAIHDFFGDEASNLFFRTMSSQEGGNRYAWVLKPMTQFLRDGEALENNTLCALLTWCLLGSTNADAPNAHAVSRLLHVFGYLKANGFPDPKTPSRDVFDTLDEASGVVPWTDCLTTSVTLGDEVAAQFSDTAQNGSSFLQATAQAYVFMHELHKLMAGIFLEDPDRYAKPTPYLDENLERWPEPPIRETFGRPFLHLSTEQAKRFEGVTFFDQASAEGEPFVRARIMRGIKESVPLQLADNWQYVCGLTDTVFAEFNRDHPEIELQRDRVRQHGLHFLEVLE